VLSESFCGPPTWSYVLTRAISRVCCSRCITTVSCYARPRCDCISLALYAFTTEHKQYVKYKPNCLITHSCVTKTVAMHLVHAHSRSVYYRLVLFMPLYCTYQSRRCSWSATIYNCITRLPHQTLRLFAHSFWQKWDRLAPLFREQFVSLL